MISKRKKRVKQRGSHTHGWGNKKKHRGAGSRGGVGRAGIKGHHKLKFAKIGQKIGKRGFNSLSQRKIKPSVKAINLRQISMMEGKEIDLEKLGYQKVLGTGEIGRAVTVKAQSFSKRAAEKIEKAGGKVISYGAEETEVNEEVS